MYRKILVCLDHSAADQTLLPHVTELARLTSAELVLAHVADGFVAQWGAQLNMAESKEMREDMAYLERIAGELRAAGFTAHASLERGDPSRQLLKLARAQGCDLIAMTTHGHRFLYDLIIGSTIDKLRHETEIPLLVVRADPSKRDSGGE